MTPPSGRSWRPHLFVTTIGTVQANCHVLSIFHCLRGQSTRNPSCIAQSHLLLYDIPIAACRKEARFLTTSSAAILHEYLEFTSVLVGKRLTFAQRPR